MGALLLPSDRFVRFGNPAWPGLKTANFADFGSWSGVLQKDTESLRDSDALMRVAVPRRRGPAGLRDPVSALLIMFVTIDSATPLYTYISRLSEKNRTQRLTRRNVCALDVAILEVSCYTDGHRKPLKNFFNFF